jgi:hypothetical protein
MHSDFITFQRLENLHVAMPTKSQTHILGMWPGDHYMPLQRFNLGSMTYFAKVSPIEAPLALLRFPHRPLLHHVVHGYSHTLHRTTEQALQENRLHSLVNR